MNHPNYLHRRIDSNTRAAHDRAFFNVLVGLIIVCVIAILAGKAHGQEMAQRPPAAKPEAKPTPAPNPPTSPYQPTDPESKDGRILQLEAINNLKDWQTAAMQLKEYSAYNQSLARLQMWCQQIQTAHGWPAEVGCDPNQNPIVFAVQPRQVQVQAVPITAVPSVTTVSPESAHVPISAPAKPKKP